MFLGLSKEQKKELEYEIINDLCRLKLARLFREKTRVEDHDSDIEIILKNRIINIARQVEGLPIYKLESDDYGSYLPAEKAWHFGELELITKRESTCELIETLCDLVDENLLSVREVNEIFKYENLGISVIYESNNVNVEITEELDSDENNSEHPNIRALVKRMDLLLENSDYSGVLHTSASIFETLAKTVLNRINLEDKTLGSFFDAYKNKSHLPEPILDMIKNIYSKRNTEPLAGHGSTSIPSVTKKDAIVIVEMTKAFIKMERKLAEPELTSV